MSLHHSPYETLAIAYVLMLQNSGITLSLPQRKAIGNFILSGKKEGWFQLLKRLYLPVWGNNTPNSVDLITGGSGTFSGTVSAVAGYVQGDGSTGYFDFGATPVEMGIATSSGMMIGVLQPVQDATTAYKSIIGSYNSNTQVSRLSFTSANQIQSRLFSIGAAVTANTARTGCNGIIFVSRDTLNNCSIYQRKNAGFSALNTSTASDSGTVPTYKIYAMAESQFNTPVGHNTGTFGAFFAGAGMTQTQSSQFSLALKTLWETLTGLTLP